VVLLRGERESGETRYKAEGRDREKREGNKKRNGGEEREGRRRGVHCAVGIFNYFRL